MSPHMEPNVRNEYLKKKKNRQTTGVASFHVNQNFGGSNSVRVEGINDGRGK